MRLRISRRNYFRGACICASLIVLVYAFSWALSGSGIKQSPRAELNPGGTSYLDPSSPVIDIAVQLLAIDTAGQFATVHYMLQPAGPNEPYGTTDWFENRVDVAQLTRVNVGSLGIGGNGEASHLIEVGPTSGFSEVLNAYDEGVPESQYIADYDGMTNYNSGILGIASSGYPFDSYLVDVGTTVTVNDGKGNWIPVPSSAYYSGSGIPGFQVGVDRVPYLSDAAGSCQASSIECGFSPDWRNGQSRLQLHVRRSNLTIALGLLGFLLAGICALTSLLLTIAVLRRVRTPSLNFIALHAVILFSLPAIRSSIPGNPSLGIALDAVIFFPSLVVVVTCLGVSAFLWITRDDAVWG